MAKNEQSMQKIIMKKARRLEKITILPCYKICVIDTDKNSATVDLSTLIEKLEVFAPLEDIVKFAKVEIADFGFTLEWESGASLDAERLFEMFFEQKNLIDTEKSYKFWNYHENYALSQSTMF